MSLAVKRYSDLRYHASLAAAVERGERRIRRGCCLACGIPSEGMTCVRVACWEQLGALPADEQRQLLDAYASEHPAPSLWADLLHVGGALAGLVGTVAVFAVIVWPQVRWLVGK